MTRTIGEGEAVKAAIAKHGRIFRLNTWFRFEGGFYGMGVTVKPIKAKIVQAGLLGWPLKVTLGGPTGFDWKQNQWCGRTILPPTGAAGLDYDRWLGPAPSSHTTASGPRHLPRILGLRRWRARRHGPALPRPRPVPPRQG
jgi:hypothetical protein